MKKGKAISFIHFNPQVKVDQHTDENVFTDCGEIHISGLEHLELGTYGYSEEFNKIQEAQVLKISFNKSVMTTITPS